MARRKKHEDHENHERWLVSYADFITLLFAFFVVMYALSSVNEGIYKILSDSITKSFNNNSPSSEKVIFIQAPIPQGTAENGKPIPQAIPMSPPEGRPTPVETEKQQRRENMKSVATDVLKVIEPLVQGGQVKVTESDRGISIEINASLLFETAKADLNKDSIDVLSAVAKVLATDTHQIQVEGHTDNLPIKSPVFPSNWELSAARASSVIRLFSENGVGGARMVAIGYGDNRPVEDNATPAGRSRNRRVTIMILAENQGNVQDVRLDPDIKPASSTSSTPAPSVAVSASPAPAQ
jgi:chemotaxis protein MotB